MASPPSRPAPAFSPAALAAALVAFVFGFLPVMNWVPGGYGDPAFGLMVTEWLAGSAIAIGAGLVLAILFRRTRLPWERDDAAGPPSPDDGRRAGVPARLAGAVLPLAAFALYALAARDVFSGQPLYLDETVNAIQARIFASGRLWVPAPEWPELVQALHLVIAEGRLYSHYPPGHPAMLALGALTVGTWIVGPLFGAASVVLFAAIARRAEADRRVATAAAIVFALAPFVLFMSGSHMNHVTVLTWTLVGVAALAAVMDSPAPRPFMAFLSGIGFGMAATVRPSDALAFALPAGIWYLWRALRDRRRWLDALPSALGVALPMLVMMWVNVNTTGGPLLFGYVLLWGKGHGLGFHTPPWGPPHTPGRGAEMLNLYFQGLQRFLFETLVPSLLPATGALALARRLSALDRYLLASSGILVLLYFLYWGEGFFLGPRFVYSLTPMLVLWTVRLPSAVRDRFGPGLLHRATLGTLLVAAVVAAAWSVPTRWRRYSSDFPAERWNVQARAREAGVRGAIVLVRDSWNAQQMARMWALGVSHPSVERLFRGIDACRLEHALVRLEDAGIRGRAASDSLFALMGDAERVRPIPMQPRVDLYVQEGATYTARCLERLQVQRAGSMALVPALLPMGADGNLYVRDLRERTAVVLDRYPDRPVFLLAPESRAPTATPRFTRVSRDSLRAAWAATNR